MPRDNHFTSARTFLSPAGAEFAGPASVTTAILRVGLCFSSILRQLCSRFDPRQLNRFHPVLHPRFLTSSINGEIRTGGLAVLRMPKRSPGAQAGFSASDARQEVRTADLRKQMESAARSSHNEEYRQGELDVNGAALGVRDRNVSVGSSRIRDGMPMSPFVANCKRLCVGA